MGRHSRNQQATAEATSARRLMDLAAVPPPPGAVPLDLPTYDATQNSWLQPEFVAWNNASEADKASGAWRNALPRAAALQGAATQRTAAKDYGVGVDGYPDPIAAPPPELPPAYGADDSQPGRYVTREPYSDAQAEPFADPTLELADASTGPLGLDWQTIATGAGVLALGLVLWKLS